MWWVSMWLQTRNKMIENWQRLLFDCAIDLRTNEGRQRILER